MTWMDAAACPGKDDLFFKTGPRPDYTDAAALCAGCPVLDQCRQDLLAGEVHVWQVHGYRAGLEPRERKDRLRAMGRRNAESMARRREALALQVEGRSLNESARILGVTARTVSRLLVQAKAELAEAEEAYAA